jgi:hypothetical protein
MEGGAAAARKHGWHLLQRSSGCVKSAGTVVFGMEDGTVSIFGLIFGVAATTTSTQTVVIAGRPAPWRPRYR